MQQRHSADDDTHPCWSPDGTRIAFERTFLGTGSVHTYTIAADGSDEQPLVEGTGPAWDIPHRIGSAQVGESVSRDVTIENTADQSYLVTGVDVGDGDFSASPAQFSVSPGGHRDVTVTFAPTTVGTKYEMLTILTDDPRVPSMRLIVNGTGLQPPNQPPQVADIPDQTIDEGGSFAEIELDGFVEDPDNADPEIAWSVSGSSELAVEIVGRVATIGVPSEDWNGTAEITFRATDPGGLLDLKKAWFGNCTCSRGPERPTLVGVSALRG